MVTVRYFAAAKDAAGVATDDVDVDLDGVGGTLTVAALRALLIARRPALERVLRQSRIAVRQRFATDEFVVDDGADVAVIPPVAGG